MNQLRLNPKLDPAPFARIYARDKCVQIHELFEPEAADWLEAVVRSLPWRMVCQNDKEENVLFTGEDIKAMSPDERRRLEDGIRERAARSIGYTYLTYPMINAAVEGWDAGHHIHLLTEFLNSPPFLEFARALIACPGLTKTDAHATHYRRGDYLTRHVDDGEIKERRAAYTIGFSRTWEPDWGGLLLFLDDKNDVIKGFRPRFNTLTVFDGLQVHAVSAISSFAASPRLSIAGWFRDDPPYKRSA